MAANQNLHPSAERRTSGRRKILKYRSSDLRDRRQRPLAAVVFFDRALPDCAAYAAALGLDSSPVIEQVTTYRYHSPVFLAPPWADINPTENVRRATFDQVIAFYRHVREAYARLDYEMIELPRAPVERRAEFIVEHIGS